MASNYTSNYQLCQWQEDDKVLRTEFNADNAKIDAALGTLSASLSGKASSSALNSLKTTVNGKADKSALDSLAATVSGKADKTALEALKTTVTQHTAALAKAGDCKIYTKTYVGGGGSETGKVMTFTFPAKPVLVMIYGAERRLTLIAGQPYAWSESRSSNSGLNVTWSGNTVSYGGGYSADQMDVSGQTYYLLALLQTG